MAKRANRKKGEEGSGKLTKEEDAVARFLRFNCPTETTMFRGDEVHYFTGSKAVDTLLESKYGTKAKKEPLFNNRAAVVAYIKILMEKQLFWRARKLVPKKKEDKDKKEKAEAGKSPKSGKKEAGKDTPKEGKKEKDKKKEETEREEDEDQESAKDKKKGSDKEEEKDDGKEKKKKKVKLEMHAAQVFNDANDVYVWVFDPTPFYKKVIGALMVLGTIVGCLFPLWPMWLRQGVYYLSLAGIGAFGVIVVVAVLRTILFGIIWLATGGRHKLWILPNLTEDCGFFESFKPFYTYEHVVSDSEEEKKKKKETKKKDKDSDNDSESKEENEKKDEEEADREKLKSEEEEGEKEKASEDEQRDEEGQSDEEGENSESVSDEASSAVDSSVPATPEEPKAGGGGGAVKRRRVRRADDDFVLVEK